MLVEGDKMSGNLIKVSDWIEKAVKCLLGLFVMLITLIIFIQVLFRYIFQQSLKGVEELPVFLMIICVYLASGLLARGDHHIKIDMLSMFIKSKKCILIIEAIMQGITFISLSVFTYLSYEYVSFMHLSGTVSPGLQLPMWGIQIFMVIGSILMTINYFINLVNGIRRLN